MVMNGKTPEERLKEAQRIVARYVPKDRDLVAELIAERRADADLGGVDDATTQLAAPVQTIKSKGRDE